MSLRLRSLLTVLLLAGLAACGAPTAMTRSSAAPESRPLFVDEDADGYPNVESPPVEAAEVELDAEVTVDAPEYAAGAAATAPARPSMDGADDAERRTTGDSLRTESVETASTGSMGGGESYVPPPNLGWSVPVEPLPWVPLDPAPVPAGPRRVLLATMELPPGRTVFPPVSACQDVLVYVQEGALEAVGTGIGTTDAPATLYPGDAARFGPEGDGRLTNRSGEPATALVIIARAADAGAPLYTSPVDGGLCELALATDPIVRPLRLASSATTAPIASSSEHLEIRILLDLESTASAHAGLTVLSGDATARIDRHVHEHADEVLYVESGEGTMVVGSERIAVHAGSVLYLPHGVEHAFEPSGGALLRMLQLYAPSGPEQRFRGIEPTP
jgi:mannose-6-phosphate isomerase-like protein (cupin superfamily)